MDFGFGTQPPSTRNLPRSWKCPGRIMGGPPPFRAGPGHSMTGRRGAALIWLGISGLGQLPEEEEVSVSGDAGYRAIRWNTWLVMGSGCR
jgi:hypothetical protein